MGQRSRANPTMVPMPREDDGIATAGRRRLRRLAGLGRADAVRPHHLVVLVFDDVAVPHELARSVEPDAYPGDLPGICDDGVLEPDLPRLRWLRGTRGSHGLSVFVHDDVLAVHHLEVHLVDVHGVGVLRRVVELPHLGRTDGRVSDSGGRGVMAGSRRNWGGVEASTVVEGTTRNSMTWPVVAGSPTGKSTPGTPPPNGSSGPPLPSTGVPHGTVVESTIRS